MLLSENLEGGKERWVRGGGSPIFFYRQLFFFYF